MALPSARSPISLQSLTFALPQRRSAKPVLKAKLKRRITKLRHRIRKLKGACGKSETAPAKAQVTKPAPNSPQAKHAEAQHTRDAAAAEVAELEKKLKAASGTDKQALEQKLDKAQKALKSAELAVVATAVAQASAAAKAEADGLRKDVRGAV